MAHSADRPRRSNRRHSARLRTRMPLVLVTGDDLPALFNRRDGQRFAHVGDGAIWLRVDRPQDLPRMAVAVRRWRDGRSRTVSCFRWRQPVIRTGNAHTVAAGRQTGSGRRRAHARFTRFSRICRGLSAAHDRRHLRHPKKPIWGHGALASAHILAPQWYGASSTARILDAPFRDCHPCGRARSMARGGQRCAAGNPRRRARGGSIIGWTQRVVIRALADQRQPDMFSAIFKAGFIVSGRHAGQAVRGKAMCRCKPASRARRAQLRRRGRCPSGCVRAMPRHYWMSPRLIALAHALALFACAAAVAFFFSIRHNGVSRRRCGRGSWPLLDDPEGMPQSVMPCRRSSPIATSLNLRTYRYAVAARIRHVYRGARLIPPTQRRDCIVSATTRHRPLS